jgi:hypothetical protein
LKGTEVFCLWTTMKFSLSLVISAILAVTAAYGGGEAVYNEKFSRAKALATVPGMFVFNTDKISTEN